jgi:hypothetical protein
MGEKLLRRQAAKKEIDDAGIAAAAALALVEEVRSLPEVRQRMALLLIDYLQGVPVRDADTTAAPEDLRSAHPADNAIHAPPGRPALPFGDEVPSPYFFC